MQQSHGWMMYVQDYDETIPEGWSDPAIGGSGGFHNLVQPYMKNYKIVECPSAKVRNWSYTYNDVLNYKSLAALNKPAETIVEFDCTQTNWCGNGDNNCVSSSSTFWAWWKDYLWTPNANYWDDSQVDPHAKLLTQYNGYSLDVDPGNTAGGQGNDAIGMPRYRHNEGMNAIFGDGHAKFRKKGSLQLYEFRYAVQDRM